MVQVRRLLPGDIPAAVRLADHVFRDSEQTSMITAFPYSFSTALSQSFGAFVDGVLVSMMGLVPAVIRMGPATVNTFLLGQVCTHETARGKGFASSVMQAVLSHIDQSNASIMLVSGSRSMYERANCLRYGHMKYVVLNRDWADALIAEQRDILIIRECTGKDWFELKRLADARPIRFEYSIWDLANLIEAESRASCMKHRHRVLVAEYEGIMQAFIIYTVPEVGKKTGHIPEIVEWAGSTNVTLQLVAHAIQRHQLQTIRFSIPIYDTGLLEMMNKEPARSGNFPGTIHVIQPERLVKQLQPYFKHNGIELPMDLQIKAVEGHAVIVETSGVTRRFSAQQWIDALFTVQGKDNALAQMLSSTKKNIFPIPIPSPHGLLYV